jgi:hypothetical protein
MISRDTAGEIRIDFAWGNMPMQPDNDRATHLDLTLDNHILTSNGWNGYPDYSPGVVVTQGIEIDLDTQTFIHGNLVSDPNTPYGSVGYPYWTMQADTMGEYSFLNIRPLTIPLDGQDVPNDTIDWTAFNEAVTSNSITAITFDNIGLDYMGSTRMTLNGTFDFTTQTIPDGSGSSNPHLVSHNLWAYIQANKPSGFVGSGSLFKYSDGAYIPVNPNSKFTLEF